MKLFYKLLNNPVYFLRLVAAFIQINVVFHLAENITVLGQYSLITAGLAIAYQVLSFEGHLDILSHNKSYETISNNYGLTSFIYVAVLCIVYFVIDNPLLLAFLITFYLKDYFQWILDFKTAVQRRDVGDIGYHKYLSVKIIIFECACPLFIVFNGNLLVFQYYNIALLTLIIVTSVILFARKKVAVPNLFSLLGATLKRVDSMYLRLFVGLFMSVDALGQIQPLLSVSRILTLLTPTWIALNLTKKLKEYSKVNFPIVKVFFSTNVLYIFSAILAWFFQSYYLPVELDIYYFVLIFVYIGGANLKAVVRALSIMSDNRQGIDTALLLVLVLRTLVSLLFIGNLISILIIIILSDILVSFYFYFREKHANAQI